MKIEYGFHSTPFGKCSIAVSNDKIVLLSYSLILKSSVEKELKTTWNHACLLHDEVSTKPFIDLVFNEIQKNVNVLLKGTPFQIKVWQALRSIPKGTTTTYKDISKSINSPQAARAVGSACGKNRIAYLIPCHRVLPSTGRLGLYNTGSKRKKELLKFEGVIM